MGWAETAHRCVGGMPDCQTGGRVGGAAGAPGRRRLGVTSQLQHRYSTVTAPLQHLGGGDDDDEKGGEGEAQQEVSRGPRLALLLRDQCRVPAASSRRWGARWQGARNAARGVGSRQRGVVTPLHRRQHRVTAVTPSLRPLHRRYGRCTVVTAVTPSLRPLRAPLPVEAAEDVEEEQQRELDRDGALALQLDPLVGDEDGTPRRDWHH